MQSPFHAYYTAKKLETLSDDNVFLPVFASSTIKVLPFQIAAATFALRSPYQNGVILCDESGMGKSHEAMLVMAQSYYEGKNKILLCIPNADLLSQWVELLDRHYTVPYFVITNREQWQKNINRDFPNAFLQDGIVLSTYDFISDNESAAKDANFDICVFEEATALSSVYEENNKQGKALKRVSDNAFKILLTGTPIEKNIMDLYGLIYFIDETILPDEKIFLQRYLRKPENYPELAERVSQYCFRTLRNQAKQYAKIPDRTLLTLEYNLSEKEQELYDLLYTYINKESKIAFPEMDKYDLALRFLGLFGSSTSAILQTIKGLIKRLPNDCEETEEFLAMEQIAESIEIDTKTKHLQSAIGKILPILSKMGANKKCVIFTESVETQKYLYAILSKQYKTLIYSGSAATDYSVISEFKTSGEILISTDNGARGFNLEECSFIVNYDLIYNTLKMEQRIDRCHRLNQQNDVIVLSFVDTKNFADIRKLELVNKRLLVSDGVFGISDKVVGGFTDDLDKALADIKTKLRTKGQIETDFQNTINDFESENRQIVAQGEELLFTTFTKEVADKVKITPQYVARQAEMINNNLWEIVKWYFNEYNKGNSDCKFLLDDNSRVVIATDFDKLPTLFYYYTGSQTKRYTALKQFKNITLTTPLAKGITYNIECYESGTLTVEADIELCQIALYTVYFGSKSGYRMQNILVGKTESGKILTADECEKILMLPIINYTEDGKKSSRWLKNSTGGTKAHPLDNLVDAESILQKHITDRNTAISEEIDRIKLRAKSGRTEITHSIDELKRQLVAQEKELKEISNDRLKTLSLEKKLTALKNELMKKEENQFFEGMQLDLEIEENIKAFLDKERLTAKLVREFVINVEGGS